MRQIAPSRWYFTRRKKKQTMPANNMSEVHPTPPPATVPTAVPPPSSATGKPSPPPQQLKKKKPSDFKFGKIIGEGSYSEVVHATEIESGKEYAIKILEKRHMLRERKAKYVMREREILSRLNHPFFVKLYFTFQDSDKLYFVLSLAKKGELLQYIIQMGSFDMNCTRFYAAEIATALQYLHSLGIIHRDLKPENILLNENMHVAITDFGTAKILNQDQGRANSFVGTAQYVSPELLTDKSACKSSDLWGLGCIIYQLLAGLPPFRAGNEYLIFQKIIKLEYDFPDGFPAVAKDLVQKLLMIDPSKRLGCDECGGYASLRAHPFFEGVDWDTLHKETPPCLKPYFPEDTSAEDLSDYNGSISELSERIRTEFDGIELVDASGVPEQPEPTQHSIVEVTPEERQERLADQSRRNKWHRFVEGHLILKMGLVDKRKGLFPRRRQLLLTEGPHLYYVDPENMILKGQIPWSEELWVEAKNFKTFFVHTPNRTYYLIDPEGNSHEWCKAIEEVRRSIYGPRS